MSITEDGDKVLLYIYNHFMNSQIGSKLGIQEISSNLKLDNDIQETIDYLVKEEFIRAQLYMGPRYLYISDITSSGIDYIEDKLDVPASELQKRKEERKIILEKLYEYKKRKV